MRFYQSTTIAIVVLVSGAASIGHNHDRMDANKKVNRAMGLFEKLEGSDIHPAGGVALGALIEAVKQGAVESDDIIALNITGGGEKRIKAEGKVHYLEPFAHFSVDDIHSEGIEEKIEKVLRDS